MMKKTINIKISTDTYLKLTILKGWLGANKRRRVGLDEAISRGIDEVCRQNIPFSQALETALENDTEESSEVEYA